MISPPEASYRKCSAGIGLSLTTLGQGDLFPSLLSPILLLTKQSPIPEAAVDRVHRDRSPFLRKTSRDSKESCFQSILPSPLLPASRQLPPSPIRGFQSSARQSLSLLGNISLCFSWTHCVSLSHIRFLCFEKPNFCPLPHPVFFFMHGFA